MRKWITGLVIATGAASSAVAAESRLQLRASIPEHCQVVSTARAAAPEGEVRLVVRTACNAETFALAVSNIEGPVRVLSAASPEGRVLGGADGRLSIRLDRPGFQTFSLALGEAGAGDDPPSVRVVAG